MKTYTLTYSTPVEVKIETNLSLLAVANSLLCDNDDPKVAQHDFEDVAELDVGQEHAFDPEGWFGYYTVRRDA